MKRFMSYLTGDPVSSLVLAIIAFILGALIF